MNPNSQILIKRYCPNFKDVGDYFKNYLEKYILPNSKILDLGCGRKTFGEIFYKKAALRVGIDPDKEALKENVLMDEKYCWTIENIPKNIGPFDVITCQWVLEHLKNPQKEIKVISDLCLGGGYFIFMTTNIYSPIIFLSKICPTNLKKILKRSLFDTPEADTYPTKYKINTLSKIDQYLTNNGFKKIALQRVSGLGYFSFNKYILRGKIFLDRILAKFKIFDLFSTHIIGVYQKIKF